MWHLDSYPLAEEIGDPDLFVGREKEMTRLLKWAAGTKQRLSKSMGILSRRKKGKTALLQRFFNILYTRNDLVMADILAQGSSNFHYRGLGDKVFAMVFRRIYGAEINRVSVEQIIRVAGPRKARFYADQQASVEIDLHAVHEKAPGRRGARRNRAAVRSQLFEAAARPGARDRFLVQAGMLLTGGKEGGLFVMIGRKRD